jgi:hypothetical protein
LRGSQPSDGILPRNGERSSLSSLGRNVAVARNSKESETYRLEMLRHFQKIDSGTPPAEVLEAEKVIANYRKEKEQTHETISRLETGLPKPDLCPECFYLHGVESSMRPIPSEEPKIDKFRCNKCDFIKEVKFGL